MSRWPNKYVIGLTGNIAVGKSVVRQMLQHLGAYTIDADGLSHQAMQPGAPAYKPVVETFSDPPSVRAAEGAGPPRCPRPPPPGAIGPVLLPI